MEQTRAKVRPTRTHNGFSVTYRNPRVKISCMTKLEGKGGTVTNLPPVGLVSLNQGGSILVHRGKELIFMQLESQQTVWLEYESSWPTSFSKALPPREPKTPSAPSAGDQGLTCISPWRIRNYNGYIAPPINQSPISKLT